MTHVSLGPIERYLQVLWERNASDLLLTAYSKPLVRIDGQLLPLEDETGLDQDHCEHLVLSILTEELKQQLRQNKEVDFSFSWNGVARFRANCIFQMGAIAMSLRIIPLKLPTLRDPRGEQRHPGPDPRGQDAPGAQHPRWRPPTRVCTLESWLNMLVQNGWITYEDAVARSLHGKEIRPPMPVPAGAGVNGGDRILELAGLDLTRVRGRLARRVPDREHDDAGEDAEDHHDDEQFDQREAVGFVVAGRRIFISIGGNEKRARALPSPVFFMSVLDATCALEGFARRRVKRPISSGETCCVGLGVVPVTGRARARLLGCRLQERTGCGRVREVGHDRRGARRRRRDPLRSLVRVVRGREPRRLGRARVLVRGRREVADCKHDDAGQDAEDHDDNQELDQSETLLDDVLVVRLGPGLDQHADGSPSSIGVLRPAIRLYGGRERVLNRSRRSFATVTTERGARYLGVIDFDWLNTPYIAEINATATKPTMRPMKMITAVSNNDVRRLSLYSSSRP
jgi:hypothetical protein